MSSTADATASVHESPSAHVNAMSVRVSSTADATASVHESPSAHVNAMSVRVSSAADATASVHESPCSVRVSSAADVTASVHESPSAHEISKSLLFGPFSEILSVRAVSKVQQIILDSGADCSALPMCYKHIGVADEQAPTGMYVDAQGNPLRTAGVRIAEVQVGQLKFKERFVISDVTMPLISLGKLYRAGWYVVPNANGLQLTDGKQSEPVSYKKQSLCVSGSIRLIATMPSSSVRAVTDMTISESLLRLPNKWTRLSSRVYGIKNFTTSFLDTTLVPVTELMWRRTTLVRRGTTWSLVEFSEEIANMENRTCQFENPETVSEVITIAHSSPDVTPEVMGFEIPEMEKKPQDSLDDREPELEQAPMSLEHTERPVDQRDELLPPESIEVDGVIINSESSLELMRSACKVLGIPESGNKAQIFKRLGRHCVQHELLQSKHVSNTLHAEFERQAESQTVAASPSAAEVQQHALTHEPYKPWCKFCVAHRARQDQHATVADHEGAASSVISIDFGFLSRTEGDQSKLTVLFAHDRHSKAVCAIPTPRKGGQAALSHMATELSRFILWLGYSSIRLRSDNENSVVAVVDAVRKILRNLGVEVTKDSVAIDDHQANGPVEQALQAVRQLACTMMSQLEAGLGTDENKILFGTDHPMWQWALNHAAWTRTRFTVSQGSTAYERLSGTLYRGKVCMFGETVMAYLKQSSKASPKWQRAIWLGKTTANDVNILGFQVEYSFPGRCGGLMIVGMVSLHPRSTHVYGSTA